MTVKPSTNGVVQPDPCQYPGHRPSDWTRTGLVVCGVCHPPAVPEEAARRGERAFGRAIRARAALIVEQHTVAAVTAGADQTDPGGTRGATR